MNRWKRRRGSLGDSSRLALVLHQRLWGHDGMTNLDEAVLRNRLVHYPASVLVVMLDDEAIPEWLSLVPRAVVSPKSGSTG